MMKELPILFSAPMVRAILDGRKTQTRRIINPQPIWIAEPNVPFKTADADPKGIINCPYGKLGDRLWVRETWQHENYPWGPYDPDSEVFYRADYLDDELGIDLEKSCDGIRRKWNPSIHMPRSASRILLEVTNVRVERLQDISEEDAIAEGVDGENEAAKIGAEWYEKPKRAYRRIWEQINGPGSWDLNPFVWVVEFKTLEIARDE